MNFLKILYLYCNTIKYLKFSQIYFRIIYKLKKNSLPKIPSYKLRKQDRNWLKEPDKIQNFFPENSFIFLNKKKSLKKSLDWNNNKRSKLWNYNLHYFDDLNAVNSHKRFGSHKKLINRWINENPFPMGNGWEPYPVSIRIVNWIKWAIKTKNCVNFFNDSLYIQSKFLSKNIEYHILGNHLFANAKALLFASCYFENDESEKWTTKSMKLLTKELNEQILDDGGHFERSTMYHAIIFEDLLDLINISNTYSSKFKDWKNEIVFWKKTAKQMGDWLKGMLHPDGEISFFNDAAFKIHTEPKKLFEYSKKLKINIDKKNKEINFFKNSGYIKVSKKNMLIIIDVASIGPDYLPGHGHADTLSFELSIFKKRVIVNSGISTYENNEKRQYERGTESHNTVTIDKKNSSDVWASFRVANRAYPFNIKINRTQDHILISASHDGYKKKWGGAIHERKWIIKNNSIKIYDKIEGNFSAAKANFFLHPKIIYRKDNLLLKEKNKTIKIESPYNSLKSFNSTWNFEFGRNLPNICLTLTILKSKPNSLVKIKW